MRRLAHVSAALTLAFTTLVVLGLLTRQPANDAMQAASSNATAKGVVFTVTPVATSAGR
jgi:hypothetical protein